MARVSMKRILAAVLVALAMFGPAQVGPYGRLQAQTTEPHPRDRAPLTFLQINDVYTTIPIDGLGGLARVATLKRQLAASGHRVVMVLAGDFLSPSVASSFF